MAVPMAMIGALQSSYFTIYATDELLIAPAVVGTLFAVARIYDGITDLLVGWWSDIRTGPAGRRRPFLLVGSLAFIAYAFMWLPPRGLEGASVVVFFAVALILFESLSTLVNVPMYALGIEVARNPRQRAFVRVLDRSVGVLGMVAGLATMQFLMNSDDARTAAVPFVLGLTLVALIANLVGSWRLREVPTVPKSSERPPLRVLAEMFKRRRYRQFTTIQAAETFCYASLAFGAAYVMRYVIEAPQYTFVVFLTYLLLQSVVPIFWYRLIPRYGVIRVWLFGQYTWVIAFAIFPFTFYFGLPAFLCMAALGGIASAAAVCAGPAVLGDIVDHDALQSGRQRQGIYMTVFFLVIKIVGALAAFCLGWMLQAAGFIPNETQPDQVIVAIGLSVSALPLGGILISIRFLRRYQPYKDLGADEGRSLIQPAEAPS